MTPQEKAAVARAAMARIANQSLSEGKINQMAEESRMGGKFSAAGLEKADRESTLNGADRLMLKGIIGRMGLGGTPMPAGY